MVCLGFRGMGLGFRLWGLSYLQVISQGDLAALWAPLSQTFLEIASPFLRVHPK